VLLVALLAVRLCPLWLVPEQVLAAVVYLVLVPPLQAQQISLALLVGLVGLGQVA
jgi:hypothetical protein